MIDNKVKLFKMSLLHGAIMTAMLGVAPVIAADSDEGEADDGNVITVTARKKSENIIEVPMNISTVSAMEISDRNLLDKEDLFRSIAGASSPQGQLILRGLSSGNNATPNTTTTFTDGVPFDFGDLYDVERVEVLRGPQGTLYGSNAIGGTVRVITKQPELDAIEVKMGVQVGSERNVDGLDQRLYGAINLPVGDDFALRITGSTAYDPRSITNVNTGVQGYSRESFLRAQLLWEPEDDLSVNMAYVRDQSFQLGKDQADLARGEGNYEAHLTSNPAAPFGYDVGISWTPESCTDYRVVCRNTGQIVGGTDPRYNSWELMDDQNKTSTDIYMLNIRKDDLGIGSLVYSGSFREYVRFDGINTWSRRDGADMFRTWIDFDQNRERTTHEIRFQSNGNDNLDWSVGYFYDKDGLSDEPYIQYQYHGDGDVGKAIASEYWGNFWGMLGGSWTNRAGDVQVINDLAQLGTFLFNNPDAHYYQESLVDYKKEQAFFGEISYTLDMGDAGEMEFGAGIRFFEFEDAQIIEQMGLWAPGTGVERAEQGGTEEGDRAKLSVSWRPSDNWSVYGLYSEGYRPGGNNNTLPQACFADPNSAHFVSRFTSDSIKNKELGYKASLNNGQFRVSAAAYQIDWTDVQTRIPLGCGFAYFSNAGEAQSKGFELETTTLLTQDLTLTFNAGYTSTEALDEQIVFLGGQPGDDLTQVPKYNYYLALDQGITIADRQAYVRLDVEGYGSYKSHFLATDEDLIPSYTKANLSARIALKEGLNLSLHVNNVFDKEIIDFRVTTGQGYGNFHRVNYASGRSMALRLNYDF